MKKKCWSIWITAVSYTHLDVYKRQILHVVYTSSPQMDSQMYTVYETLQNLGVKDKPIITVFNKQDKVEEDSVIRDFKADYTVKNSAKKMCIRDRFTDYGCS